MLSLVVPHGIDDNMKLPVDCGDSGGSQSDVEGFHLSSKGPSSKTNASVCKQTETMPVKSGPRPECAQGHSLVVTVTAEVVP